MKQRKVSLGRAVCVGFLVAMIAATGVQPATAAPSWAQIMKTFKPGWDPTSSNVCVRGDLACVQAVVTEMKRRFNPLVRNCNHDAAFSLLYLRTTEEYLQTVTNNPGFFINTPFVNHEDALFALYYFRAFDRWHKGSASRVPEAWRIAFSAADEKAVNGAGNILLGINAHIQRDLPFVLEEIGLTDRAGGREDHLKVNEILASVQKKAIAEAARRLDPTIDDAQVNGTDLDDATFLELVKSWREKAYRNAEALSNALTPTDRALVAAAIEADAAAEARSIMLASAYRSKSERTSRDVYCAANWNR